MIKVNHVSMTFKMATDRSTSIKEVFLSKLTKRLSYSSFNALTDVNFEVKRGEILGIIGRNGAGKSTILKVISGILKPTEGNIEINGTVVPMLELGSGFDPELTGKENIFLNGAILGYSEEFLAEKYNDIVEFSELEEFINVPLRNYSSGMRARLGFSIASLVQPDILIVDEVLSVGDANFKEKSRKKMLEMMKSGSTVIFVSHSLQQVKELCDRVVWLEKGQVKMIGSTAEVCSKYKI